MQSMKNIIFPLAILLFLATGCSEKFKVAAPYKNITVVYGLLDQLDTAHYIRVQKAFLVEYKSAVTMAQTPDSNFYASVNVRIERYRFDGTYKDSIHLYRVDLNNEGYPKQSGAFFNAPNYAYKFTSLLDPNYIYRIKAVNASSGEVESSDAPIIEDKGTTAFYCYSLDDSNGMHTGLDFAKTGTFDQVEFFGRYTPINNFSYNGLTSPAAFAQIIVRFNWVDSNIATHEKTTHYSDFDAGYQSLANNNFSYKISDINFYNSLSSGMKAAGPNIQRLIDRCDLMIYLGTQDFLNYLQSNLTQGTGLTGSEIEPVYTNIKGANALGLFSSRALHMGKITITSNTIDSMKQNPILSQAHIQGTSYHQ